MFCFRVHRGNSERQSVLIKACCRVLVVWDAPGDSGPGYFTPFSVLLVNSDSQCSRVTFCWENGPDVSSTLSALVQDEKAEKRIATLFLNRLFSPRV